MFSCKWSIYYIPKTSQSWNQAVFWAVWGPFTRGYNDMDLWYNMCLEVYNISKAQLSLVLSEYFWWVFHAIFRGRMAPTQLFGINNRDWHGFAAPKSGTCGMYGLEWYTLQCTHAPLHFRNEKPTTASKSILDLRCICGIVWNIWHYIALCIYIYMIYDVWLWLVCLFKVITLFWYSSSQLMPAMLLRQVFANVRKTNEFYRGTKFFGNLILWNPNISPDSGNSFITMVNSSWWYLDIDMYQPAWNLII